MGFYDILLDVLKNVKAIIAAGSPFVGLQFITILTLSGDLRLCG